MADGGDEATDGGGLDRYVRDEIERVRSQLRQVSSSGGSPTQQNQISTPNPDDDVDLKFLRQMQLIAADAKIDSKFRELNSSNASVSSMGETEAGLIRSHHLQQAFPPPSDTSRLGSAATSTLSRTSSQRFELEQLNKQKSSLLSDLERLKQYKREVTTKPIDYSYAMEKEAAASSTESSDEDSDADSSEDDDGESDSSGEKVVVKRVVQAAAAAPQPVMQPIGVAGSGGGGSEMMRYMMMQQFQTNSLFMNKLMSSQAQKQADPLAGLNVTQTVAGGAKAQPQPPIIAGMLPVAAALPQLDPVAPPPPPPQPSRPHCSHHHHPVEAGPLTLHGGYTEVAPLKLPYPPPAESRDAGYSKKLNDFISQSTIGRAIREMYYVSYFFGFLRVQLMRRGFNFPLQAFTEDDAQIFIVILKEVHAVIVRVYNDPYGEMNKQLRGILRDPDYTLMLGRKRKQVQAGELDQVVQQFVYRLENVVYQMTDIMPETGVLGTHNKSGMFAVICEDSRFPPDYLWDIEKANLNITMDGRTVDLTLKDRRNLVILLFLARGLIKSIFIEPVDYGFLDREPEGVAVGNLKMMVSVLAYMYRGAWRDVKELRRGFVEPVPLYLLNRLFEDDELRPIMKDQRIGQAVLYCDDLIRKWSAAFVKKLQENRKPSHMNQAD